MFLSVYAHLGRCDMTQAPVLSLIVLRCSDLERSRHFYEALDLTFTHERHGTGPNHYAANIGATVLELYPSAGRSTADVRLGFVLSRSRVRLDALTQAGGRWVRGDLDNDNAITVLDPDGHTLDLTFEPLGGGSA
jgi:catechol 2,3-dioxygenase-like lactoylglutathione lyase family enzyme